MSQLIETIRIVNGRVMNIRWHNLRYNSSRSHLFGINNPEDLRKHIEVPENFRSGIVKCRITFDANIQKIEFEYYSRKPIRTLKAVHSQLQYDYKLKDRTSINQLYQQKKDCDDILIIKNGCVTDTSYANIAFLNDGKWYTPDAPLLKGTRRKNLINKGKIHPVNVPVKQIMKFTHACIFNAMIPFGEIIIPVNRISVD